MLKIKNLAVSIYNEKQQLKPVLQGFDLSVPAGSVHVMMGPNGSGKSTLTHVLAGRSGYHIASGNVLFNNEDLLALSPDERALRGLFLAFQYPIEIPGVNNMVFMRSALNAIRKKKNLPILDAADFLMLIKQKIKLVGFDESFLQRALNEGFSGGEKKRNEILQMLLFEPTFIVLDEIDSGLDIDALQMVATCVNSMRDEKRSFLIVTHYPRLLEYIKPDAVHVMGDGKIQRSGDKTLADALEQKGYAWLNESASCP